MTHQYDMSGSEDGQLQSPEKNRAISIDDDVNDTDSLDIKPPQASMVVHREISNFRHKEKLLKDKHSKDRKFIDVERDRTNNRLQRPSNSGMDRDRRPEIDIRREERNNDIDRYHHQQRSTSGGYDRNDDCRDMIDGPDRRYPKHYERAGVVPGVGAVNPSYHHHHHHQHQQYHHQQMHIHIQRRQEYYERGQPQTSYHTGVVGGGVSDYHNNRHHQYNKHSGIHLDYGHHDVITVSDPEREHRREKYGYQEQDKDNESLEQDLRSRLLSKRHKYTKGSEIDDQYDLGHGVGNNELIEQDFDQCPKLSNKAERHKLRREKKKKNNVIDLIYSPELIIDENRHRHQRKHKKRNKEREAIIPQRAATPDDPELLARREKFLHAEREKEKLKETARNELRARRELRIERKKIDALSPSAVAASVTAGLNVIKRKKGEPEKENVHMKKKRIKRIHKISKSNNSKGNYDNNNGNDNADDGGDADDIGDDDDDDDDDYVQADYELNDEEDNELESGEHPSPVEEGEEISSDTDSVSENLNNYSKKKGGKQTRPVGPISGKIDNIKTSEQKITSRSKRKLSNNSDDDDENSSSENSPSQHSRSRSLSHSRSRSRSRSLTLTLSSESRSRSRSHSRSQSPSRSQSNSRSRSRSRSHSSQGSSGSSSPNSDISLKSRSISRSVSVLSDYNFRTHSCSPNRSDNERQNLNNKIMQPLENMDTITLTSEEDVVQLPAYDEQGILLPNYYPGVQGCRSVEEFQCLNRIEEGTYGVVYRAKDKRTNEIVALKRLKMEKEKEGFPITSLREINTLLKGQHPNIVTVREIVVGSNMDKIFIVMDYVEHDLKSLMETMKHRKQTFIPAEVKCLTQQLLKAVGHLHDNWILHRDLKTSNLLLSHKGILKVGDFGLAREYGSPLKQYTSLVVTQWYRAPELLLCSPEYSTPIDIWSVGCIFGEFLQMTPLFPGKSEIDQLNRIFRELGTPTEEVWPGYTQLPAVQNIISQNTQFMDYPVSNMKKRFGEKTTDIGILLLQGLLAYDPKIRLTAEGALKHDYFTETPLPIDPSMFPTWPAKSEMSSRKGASSPKPPSGGLQFKQLGRDDYIVTKSNSKMVSGIITGNKKMNTGFVLNAGIDQRQLAMGPGFSLKF